MPIEKNFTSLNFKSKQEEKKTKLFKLKKLLSNHRFQSRQNFRLKPINFLTVVTFFPFVLGFAEFVYKKSTVEKSDLFFQKNLPALTFVQPKLNFETFEYIVKSNSFNAPQKNFKDFFTKTFLFGDVKYDKTFLFGQPNFIGTLQNRKTLDGKKFNGLSCKFSDTSLGNFPNQKFSTNFDLLPAYLENIFEKEQKVQSLESVGLFSKKQEAIIDLSLGEKEITSFTLKEKFLSKSPTVVQLINRHAKNVFTVDPLVPDFKNQFLKDHVLFSKTRNQLNSEIKNLFLEKNLVSITNNESEENLTQNQSIKLKQLINDFSEIEQNFLIEKILSDFQKNQISDGVTGFRNMSGYNYPDMNVLDLQWFYLQKSIFGKFVSGDSKIEKPTFLAFSKNNHLPLKQFPKTLIEIKKIRLNTFETPKNKVLYTGPALVLDSDKAFDWKTHETEHKKSGNVKPVEQNTLRSWLSYYLSPYNPLAVSQENFFGLFDSPEFLKGQKSENLLKSAKQSLFQFSYDQASQVWHYSVFGKQSNFEIFKPSFHLVSETDSKNNFFSKASQNLRGIDLKFSNQEQVDSTSLNPFIPLVELRQPEFTSLTSKSTIWNSSPNLFETSLLSNLDYFFLNQTNFEEKWSSGRYQKISSVFSKNLKSNRIFSDNWEPLTTSSWLVVSQLSFAVLIFYTLKSLADNYGRELLGYLLDLVSALGVLDDSLKQEIEILMGERQKGFRVVSQSRKNFSNIVGIQHILPEIYEVVWFLRNSARDFALSKTLPRGILLTGPPGTGKTLLVQALAGEAQVPVVVLSGSSLIEPGESGALKLELVFQEARQVAPCIVFIDEIDTLAHKRSGLVQNPMGPDELLESLTSSQKSRSESALDFVSNGSKLQESQSEQGLTNSEKGAQPQSSQEQLSLLTQFLIELDGIQGRDGVVVIGATNRPEVLDPALLRPGRFDKILQVGLPGRQKRVEILKFYGQTLGYEAEIPWNYLGDRTAGFTAADLATLMNESSIRAILNKSSHTIQTIEHGIDRLTTSESEKYKILKTKTKYLSRTSTLSLLRLAYYQAGKIVLSQMLQTHPLSVVATLWPRRPTIRSLQITTNLQNSVFEFARLSELHDRLVGCYAGKASEFLFLQTFSYCQSTFSCELSTLGIEDLIFGQKLIYCLLEKWAFYSKKSTIQKTLILAPNINAREFRENPEKIEFYNNFLQTIQIPPMAEALETQTSSLGSKKEEGVLNSNAQFYYSIPWWQNEISSELEFVEKNFANWSRIYLSNPEQSDRNPEWLPPDEFFHTSSGLKNVKTARTNLHERSQRSKLSTTRTPSQFLGTLQNLTQLAEGTKQDDPKLETRRGSHEATPQQFNELEEATCQGITSPYITRVKRKTGFSWNNISEITRDYSSHSLVLQSFNRALMILNENRELLDRVVIELLYKEILRQPEIEILLNEFQTEQLHGKAENSCESQMSSSAKEKTNNKGVHFVETSWGSQSRKPLPRWIDFGQFYEETT